MAQHDEVVAVGVGGGCSEQRGRVLHAEGAALFHQRKQRRFRRDRRGGGRRRARAFASLSDQWRTTRCRAMACRGASAARSRRVGTTHRPPRCRRPRDGAQTAPSLKLGKSRDDKRRHFVRDEVLACKALTKIDLFLTHEAPRPFYPAGRRIDAGRRLLNDVLAAMKPRLHLFGHHHEFTDSSGRGSARSASMW